MGWSLLIIMIIISGIEVDIRLSDLLWIDEYYIHT